MRIAATVIIALSLTALGLIVFAEFQGKTRRPGLTTEEVRRPMPSSPTSSEPVEPASGPTLWYREIDRAKQLAQSGNKLIVVDVYTDWCGWCKKMDEVVYSDPRVAGLSRREVFLKLDAEDGGEGQRFAREMRVTGYPTTIILDGNGNKITERKGFVGSAVNFLQFVESARSRG